MVRTQIRLFVLLLNAGILVVACSDSGERSDEKSVTGEDEEREKEEEETSNDPKKGRVLDQEALASNCRGEKVEKGKKCDEKSLVCEDEDGTSCVCGGFNDNNNDLVWECFSIGNQGSDMGGAQPVEDEVHGPGGEGGSR